jgi:uncharacterized glyoxalase superfamily protein PhnB
MNEVELDFAYEKLSEGGRVRIPLGNYGFSKKFGWCERPLRRLAAPRLVLM